MSKLNKDILFLIFEELQEDSKSLFSCLMVNKFCKSPLFIIFSYYLFDDIKEFITEQGIQLIPIIHKSLLFDYLSFCKSINVNTIRSIISIGSTLVYNQFSMQEEFYFLYEKMSGLKYFDMRSIKHQIFYFPGTKACLESLCELNCDTSHIFMNYHNQLIQRLIIDGTVLSKFYKLKTLISDGYISLIKELEQLKKQAYYHNLEILNLERSDLNTFSSIIENSGECLKKILFRPHDIIKCHFYGDSLIFIRKVYENCPYIEYLSILFSPSIEHFIELENLLKFCKILKSLLLNIGVLVSYERILESGTELLKILIRPALSILTIDSTYMEEDYIKLINKLINLLDPHVF
ncbi:hypothetical protein GLOIN_2v1870025 [Rhizophagus clarus]|uniref:Uncharacterized protein n=1 Tax=Rhizophagus clarus TaxID=94130 RepID=A0A8H3KY87_9GLOM|nr:hypothetical protein GLOIN_2v1870025 [Rhizophagus clarus]